MDTVIDQLKKLKKLPRVKKYKNPITIDDFIYIRNWMIGYVIEDCHIKKQKSLSISRTDKKEFTKYDLENSIPELFEVFKPKMGFSMNLTYRGFTIVLIVE